MVVSDSKHCYFAIVNEGQAIAKLNIMEENKEVRPSIKGIG